MEQRSNKEYEIEITEDTSMLGEMLNGLEDISLRERAKKFLKCLLEFEKNPNDMIKNNISIINKMKKILISTLALLMLIGLSGCEKIEEKVERKNLQTYDTLLNERTEFNHEFDNIELKTVYTAGNYDIGKWLITDSKCLDMKLSVESVNEGDEIFVEHVHADVSIAADYPEINGMIQDTMDDSYHGYSQDGFYVTKKYPYEEIFSIEGYSQFLLEGWSHYCGEYGYGTIWEKRLTEKSLYKNGAYANKITIIYNLNIKHKGEKYKHTKVIKDEFYIKTTYEPPKED